MAAIGAILPKSDDSGSSDVAVVTTTTTVAPTTTTVPPTTTTVAPMSKERVAYLTVIELVPAFVRADATEAQVWEMLGTICTGFEGGLSYLEIGTILVESADTANIYPFGYSEAGVLVGTATNLRCPQYDGWQNS
jgi:hypothetical protein